MTKTTSQEKAKYLRAAGATKDRDGDWRLAPSSTSSPCMCYSIDHAYTLARKRAAARDRRDLQALLEAGFRLHPDGSWRTVLDGTPVRATRTEALESIRRTK